MLKILAMAMMVFLLGLAGCDESVALRRGQTQLDTSRKSIAVVTIRTENQLKPDSQTARFVVFFKPASGLERVLLDDSTDVTPQYVDHVISLALEPGSYSITKLWGITKQYGIFSGGRFEYIADLKFDVPPNSVIYLGHLLIVNRQSHEGEPRSGPVLPLVPQALSGFADGATDFTISDASAEDLPLLKKNFPCLQNLTIQKAVLTRPPNR
jgi:hypothetical protein